MGNENLDTILRDWGKMWYKKSLVEALNRYKSLGKKQKTKSRFLENDDLEKILKQSRARPQASQTHDSRS